MFSYLIAYSIVGIYRTTYKNRYILAYKKML